MPNAPRDIVGLSFGKLTVIEDLGKRRGNRWFRVECECGESVCRSYSSLQEAEYRRDGCPSCRSREKRRDPPPQCGRWTVVGEAPASPHGARRFAVVCSECGEEKVVQHSTLCHSIRTGGGCIKCHLKKARKRWG